MFATIELFAGAGGLALGVEKAGFNTIGLIEFDKDACETLQTNRPNWNVICDDIANVSSQNLEELFNIKKEIWIYFLEEHHVKLFLMQVRGLD